MTQVEQERVIERCHWMLLKYAAIGKRKYGTDLRELYQVGVLAILQALVTQYADKPVSFTRLQIRVKGAIDDYFRKETGNKRKELPEGIADDIYAIAPQYTPEELLFIYEEEAKNQERERLLEEAIDSLPEQEREVITRYYCDQEKMYTICNSLKKSTVTVWKWHRSGLAHLREFYSTRGYV